MAYEDRRGKWMNGTERLRAKFYGDARMVGQTWPLLDSIRIGAALLVVLGHCRFLYFGTPENVAQSNIWRQLFYLFTGLGHEAVVLFFVLSGFLVGGQILASKAKGVFYPWA